MGDLTAKQEQFCKEYIIDLNATQAAIRAGYSPTSAKQIAGENMTKHDIKERIQELADKRSERTEITADRVLNEISRMAFFNFEDVVNEEGQVLNLDKWSRDDLAAIQEITEDLQKSEGSTQLLKRKVKLADKRGSLELLGKHLKLFTDKVEHSGSIDLSGKSDSELQAIIERGKA